MDKKLLLEQAFNENKLTDNDKSNIEDISKNIKQLVKNKKYSVILKKLGPIAKKFKIEKIDKESEKINGYKKYKTELNSIFKSIGATDKISNIAAIPLSLYIAKSKNSNKELIRIKNIINKTVKKITVNDIKHVLVILISLIVLIYSSYIMISMSWAQPHLIIAFLISLVTLINEFGNINTDSFDI